MSENRLPEVIDIGRGAARRLAAFCAARRQASGDLRPAGALRLVADRDTWEAAGAGLEAELRAAGLPFRATVFAAPGLAADADGILRLLVDDDPRERLYIAVGSGTVTDIVRFACHRTGRDFACYATAPSVDAYASAVAPIVVEGAKRTFAAGAPVAVFADTEVLARAPRPMISAGFGDAIGKFTSVADWRLGALAWGESLDEAIARRSLEAAGACAAAAAGIGGAEGPAVETLMRALVDSGLCMAETGHSRSASGAEHHYSHFWEMRLLAEGRPPILHGLKVAIGCLEAARLWGLLRGLARERAASALAAARLPGRAAEERRIREAYGAASDEIIAANARLLSMGEAEFDSLKSRVLAGWDAIREIAAGVPAVGELERLLRLAGCPLDPRELGLGEAEIALGLERAHYVRERFTVKKLALLLGIG